MRVRKIARAVSAGLFAFGAAVSGVAGQERPGESRRDAALLQRSVVDVLRDRGAKLTTLGVTGGVSGWLVERGGREPYSLYVTPEGYSIAGLLYAPDGGLLTGAQLRDAGKGDAGRRPGAAGEKPGSEAASGSSRAMPRRVAQAETGGRRVATLAERRAAVAGRPVPAGLLARSAEAFGFTLGHRGRLVVVFGDPGCEWSRTAVAELGRMALDGRFRLRVVVVGVLGAESASSAIRIASSADPALAWFGRDVAAEHRAGGQWVEENNAVFEAWGEDSVPVIAWPSPAGGNTYRVGSLPDPELWLEEVFGL